MENNNKRILVLGAFGYFNGHLDGQTIKTRNTYELIKQNYKGKVDYFDTLKVRKNPLLLFTMLVKIIRCDTIIMLPCLNNLTYLFPMIYYMSKIFCFKIIHICIGGWQIEYFKGNERFTDHKKQLELTRRIKAILPEMKRVNEELKSEFALSNTEYLPNFRFFEIDGTPINRSFHDGLKLVYMARINKKKGYKTIFDFVESIRNSDLKISVDFYGPIEEADKEDFMSLVSQYSNRVEYKGVLQPKDIKDTLSEYDLMLFPTTYYTEGFPGTILDAYIAGIPVLATNWKHAHEFIDDGETGFIVPFDNCQEDFNNRIKELYSDKERLTKMKSLAQKKSLCYSAEEAWNVLSKYL